MCLLVVPPLQWVSEKINISVFTMLTYLLSLITCIPIAIYSILVSVKIIISPIRELQNKDGAD